MEAITKYKANDGSEWATAEQAEAREVMIREVNIAMLILVSKPTDMDFANGHGYIQQEAEKILDAKRELYKIANREGVLKHWIDRQKNDHGKTDEDFITCHPSWFSRMLDGSHRPLDAAYSRLYCIDEQNREWGQPYYAINPDKGEQVCLNPENL